MSRETYCTKCKSVFQEKGNGCPVCGGTSVKEPASGDWCFLAERETMWEAILSDFLTRHKIPYLREPVMGAGMALKVGSGMERYRFYVPYAYLATAREFV